MGDITIENHELIITSLNQLDLNHNLIVGTNGILGITDISFINVITPNKIKLRGTTSKIVFLGGVSANNDFFIENYITLEDGATANQINTDVIPCLLGETKVLTKKGWEKVKNLRCGDIIITQNERETKIVNVYASEIKTTKNNSPYIIPAHYFSRNYPKKQFMISPLHAIATNKKCLEWCIPKIHCKDLKRMELGKEISYYHIELPNWLTDHLIIEGGTLVESYAKNFHGDLDSVFYVRSSKTGYYKRDMEKYGKALELYQKRYKTNKDRKIIFE